MGRAPYRGLEGGEAGGVWLDFTALSMSLIIWSVRC